MTSYYAAAAATAGAGAGAASTRPPPAGRHARRASAEAAPSFEVGGGRPQPQELNGASSSFYERARRRRNRDLRDEIRGQRDGAGILDLFVERGELWDAISVSTALHAVAWRVREAGPWPDLEADRRWLLLRSRVQAKLAEGEPRNLANNAWSLATIPSGDRPLLADLAWRVPPAAAEFKAQEVSNTCWAMATAKWVDEPLFRCLAAETLAKAADGVNQDLTNTLWAFATVACLHEPMFVFLCECSVGRVPEFKPQEVANAAWSLATVPFRHDALTIRLSRHALELLPEFRTQNLANFAWAYAKLGHSEDVVVAGLLKEALQKLDHFSAQDLSTAVWAFATAPFRDDRFLLRCASSLRPRAKTQSVQPQHISNVLWAFATVPFLEDACFGELTAHATRQLDLYKPQELSNAIWACASVLHRDEAFTDALAAEAARRLEDFDTQGIGNTSWAVSLLGTPTRDLFYRVWGRLGESGCLMRCTDKIFSMLVWAFFRCGEPALAWRLLERCALNRVNPGVAALGVWLHYCRHRHPDVDQEIRVLTLLAKHRPCRHLMIAALNAAALRLEELDQRPGAAELLDRLAADGAGDAVTDLLRERLPASAGQLPKAGGARCVLDWRVPARLRGNPRCDYEKECQVLRYVLATARQGDPWSVVESIERFSLDGHGWLKIAGDEKGVVLDTLVGELPPSPPRFVLEFGCYVGYSATRMARLLRPHGGRLISVEVDPVHACIARSVLEFAGVADVVSVYVGYSEEAIPRLHEPGGAITCSGRGADVVFMDQRGTRFHLDLQALEAEGLLADRCVVVADNVLKPGAPHFLWHLQACERYELTVVSLREFAAELIEDWMVVARYAAPAPGAATPADSAFPEVLSELAFKTDRARARSCAADTPGEVGENEWACHSQEVRRAYAAAGICPRIVHVRRREDGGAYVDWAGRASERQP